MTRAQKIFAVAMAVIGIVSSAVVAVSWFRNGGSWLSIVTAVVFYGGVTAVIWATINDLMKED